MIITLVYLLVFQPVHLLRKSLRLLSLSWNKWVKRRPSELFQIHESVFLWRIDTEGWDTRSSDLQPSWSEKRNGLLSFNKTDLSNPDWFSLINRSGLRGHWELRLFWIICFLSNLRSIIHEPVFQCVSLHNALKWLQQGHREKEIISISGEILFWFLDFLESVSSEDFFDQFLVSSSTWRPREINMSVRFERIILCLCTPKEMTKLKRFSI